MTKPGFDPAHPGRPLTDHERRILALVAHGFTNAEIGRQLAISEDTVKHIVGRVVRKLGARNRTHAVTIGFCRGLLQIPRGDERDA